MIQFVVMNVGIKRNVSYKFAIHVRSMSMWPKALVSNHSGREHISQLNFKINE